VSVSLVGTTTTSGFAQYPALAPHASTAVGDLVLLLAAVPFCDQFYLPAGFEVLARFQAYPGRAPGVVIAQRIISTPGDIATYTFHDPYHYFLNFLALVTLRGTDLADPVAALATRNGNVGSISTVMAPSVTALHAGLLITVHATSGAHAAFSVTAPTGMTELADLCDGGSTDFRGLAVYEEAVSAGATGQRIATVSQAVGWQAAASLIIRAPRLGNAGFFGANF